MTALTKAVSTAPVTHSYSQRFANRAIDAAVPCLPPTLINTVVEYLGIKEPDPKVWIAEWIGPRGHEVVCPAVAAALPFDRATVNLVVEYLRKSDIFGLAELEASAGGKTELTNLLGPYNPQVSLPLEVDDEMQAPLSTHFSAEDLRPLGNIRLVTELFSLHWCPARMTAKIAERLAKKHRHEFDRYSWQKALEEHGATPTATDCWVLFPKNALWGGKTVQQQQALMPKGFQFPDYPVAAFCIFNTFNCTKIYIMANKLTRVDAETQGCKLAFGLFGGGGLCVFRSYDDHVRACVAPVRKYCWTLALGPLAIDRR